MYETLVEKQQQWYKLITSLWLELSVLPLQIRVPQQTNTLSGLRPARAPAVANREKKIVRQNCSTVLTVCFTFFAMHFYTLF